jgi:hypothetical protein
MILRRQFGALVASRVFAIAALTFSLAASASVILTLVELERLAAEERPEFLHRFEREPESPSWARLFSGVATGLYVQVQRSLVVAPASAFAIGGAWILFVATREEKR